MRRRRSRRARQDWTQCAMVAFGAGLFLALFCSVKLVLLIASIALIYLGATCWR